jgi:hypothetical protein
MLFEGEHCTIWADKNSGKKITANIATVIGGEFDKNIYPKMMNTFGFETTFAYDGGTITGNALDVADRLMGDGDGKLCILLLDIKDNYKPPANESYLAGYFWSGNLFLGDEGSAYAYSNQRDMIYIDINPGLTSYEELYSTIAHEMQHMINYVASYIYRKNGSGFSSMDIWIDEGLSSASEWVYSGKHSATRVQWFQKDDSGLIRKGNNFFVWGNRTKENQYAVLDDYATVYLFFQWLRLQAGTADIYHEIITSVYPNYDYRAVVNAAGKFPQTQKYGDWPALLKTWLAANYINAEAGDYGYMNEKTLKDIKAKTVPDGMTSISLFPGEAVYSIIKNSFSTQNSGSIKYAGLGAALSETLPFTGGALLSYNANAKRTGQAENAKTTGVAAAGAAFVRSLAPDPESAPPSLDQPETKLSGPFPIGIGDILRENGLVSESALPFSSGER